MANYVKTIQQYAKDVLDRRLVVDSKTRDLEGSSKFVKLNFDGVGQVLVADLVLDGLSTYSRVNEGPTEDNYSHYQNGSADGYEVGGVSLTWTPYKLRFDRGRQFQVDFLTNEETSNLIIGNLIDVFTQEKVIPEIDAIRFSELAKVSNAALGNLITETIQPNEIISKFNAAFEWLSEMEVPTEEQVIYVNPKVMTLIRNTDELKKLLTQADFRYGNITMTVDMYEGRKIIEVPSNRFFTNVVLTRNGYTKGANAKTINYMIVSKKAATPIVKLEKIRVINPELVQDFDGYKVNYRIFHDIIVPKNKIPAVYTSVSNDAAVAGTLKVSVSEGTQTNSFKVNNFFTSPVALRGRLVAKATAINLGATVEDELHTITLGEDVVDAANDTLYFALLNGANEAIAVSTAITLPKKA